MIAILRNRLILGRFLLNPRSKYSSFNSENVVVHIVYISTNFIQQLYIQILFLYPKIVKVRM